MNPDIKARWVEALRSGKYKQTKRVLNDDKGFCCLGVLCDIVKDEMGVEWSGREEGAEIPTAYGLYFDGSYELLSKRVTDFVGLAGLDGNDPQVEVNIAWPGDCEERAVRSLSTLNDDGMTFAEIANLIEEQL